MVCSVKRGDRYLYYDAVGVTPPSSRAGSLLGVAIDDALPVLPREARMTGHGLVARGVLCRAGGLGLGAADDSSATMMLVLLGAIGLWLVVGEDR